ncbi:MAG: hypothetical protein ACD_13C00022G0023 [uncultured bacterium]|uniref:Uncharacterized protein n=1 Tax=Candidatus Woesebacteria bacterium GW2011_GWA1_40_43 TaxID=1618553 RepID=A0A0G0UXD0_9BACT|nr:MAG: hypothetical protein ACD_13C00022G0023 [uncultured bacterium]KKR53264.1 MAG: hypothetical protein UT88_C0012G0028 [Candidatus Woesebacteria bacterium GW2011_GWD2_40_19]KKR58104.1 MAG: hypothetical protein UT96_C0010G0030 [Candidatus Woesebacteria bacterium GW2011_GWC2_40_30]KKR64360.1 MAG: hypothetical protein UU02_C0009G0009 [Candidatus Woesebacteria bacterium GW2011_GWA1_40_43]
MSDCCSNHSKKGKIKGSDVKEDVVPKSLVGRYLYKLGKSDLEKSKEKKGCC